MSIRDRAIDTNIMIIESSVQNIPLPGSSVDMIFTDPPYAKRYKHLYKWLADESFRVLKPGGFVAVMNGGMYKNDILRYFDCAGLTYYWDYVLEMVHKGGLVWRHGPGKAMPIITRAKNVVVYSKGASVSRTSTVGKYVSKGKSKEHHKWEQTIDSHRYYIDCFSYPNDLILDPMAGSGTTALACEEIGRRCILGDVDTNSMKGRLIKEIPCLNL